MKTIDIQDLQIPVKHFRQWITLHKEIYGGVPGQPLRHNLWYHIKSTVKDKKGRKDTPRITHQVFVNNQIIWIKKGENIDIEDEHYSIRHSDSIYVPQPSEEIFKVSIMIKAASTSAKSGYVLIQKGMLELMQPKLLVP